MTIVKDKRVQIVWVLLTCILLNAFVCSLNHATHVGFELAMGQDTFCFSDETPAGAKAPATDVHELAEYAFDCPLCGLSLLAIVVLFALGWLGRRTAKLQPRPAPHLGGPRYHWPALNPRAP